MSSHKLGNLLAKVKRAGKVPKSEYLEDGEFPVIDQGQLPISGYTNNPDVVLHSPLPTIFGDHTRAVKFAKNLFACGADGTQLLYPNTQTIDPTSFYYAVKNIDLSNYFYARHFKFLKDQEIEVPPIRSQLCIPSILSTYDDLIENNRQRIQLLEQAARLLYKEWFVHLRFAGHENTPITNGIPEGWTQGVIGDLGDVVTGKTPSKKRGSYYGDDFPFIKTPDMHGNSIVIETEESLSEEGVSSQANKTLPPRSILVSCIGTVGAVAMNATPAQTNQQINAIVPRAGLSRYWSFYMAKTLKPLIEGMGGGATMANVNKSKFAAIPVVVLSQLVLDQFNAIVAPSIDQIEQLAAMNNRLTRARDLLLPRLMNGEVTI